ncbi:hypothetical protein, partial [Frankia sp. CiP3]|uniref:hypothetical protein n=1 Tax=Frankia sp. CiP3 TaxID=2880971 RepID=UPI001EF73C7D
WSNVHEKRIPRGLETHRRRSSPIMFPRNGPEQGETPTRLAGPIAGSCLVIARRGADAEALAQRFGGDGSLVLLPVQHVFGPGPV